MASDAQDALRAVPDIGEVRVLLDDHHDSDKINAGLAADAGYLGTFGVRSAGEPRRAAGHFWRKAHTAAMERCVSAMLRQDRVDVEQIRRLTLRDLPEGKREGGAAAPPVRASA